MTKLFVTVGSTKFTKLITAVLSSPVLDSVSQAAQSRAEGTGASIVIQFGATPIQDLLFNGRGGLHAFEGIGTLPIKILSNGPPIEAVDPTDVAASLSPEAIKEQIASGVSREESSIKEQFGLKHFSMDWKASHGVVYIEFIDYVPSIGPHLKEADVVISHAGESRYHKG